MQKTQHSRVHWASQRATQHVKCPSFKGSSVHGERWDRASLAENVTHPKYAVRDTGVQGRLQNSETLTGRGQSGFRIADEAVKELLNSDRRRNRPYEASHLDSTENTVRI